MTITTTTYYFGTAYWEGGSGDLSSDWIIGSTYDSFSDGSPDAFVSSILGAPNTLGYLFFVSNSADIPYPVAPPFSSDPGVGGTLSGYLSAGFTIFDSDASYVLTGILISNASYNIIGSGSASDDVLTIDASGTWISNGYLQVGESGLGAINIDGGTLTAGAPGANGIEVGGDFGGTGALTIEGGGRLTSGGNGDILGNSVGSHGTVIVEGAGSSWRSLGSQLLVGNIGPGGLSITSQGSVGAGQLTVGVASGAVGTLSVTASGTLTTVGPYDNLGANAGSRGAAAVDGSGSLWDSAGLLGVGASGDGTLTVSNSGSISAADEIDVAEAAGSTGDLTIESGGKVTSGGTYDTIGGNAEDADGIAIVTGPGSSWILTASLVIGNDGIGKLEVANQGSVGAGQFTVGQDNGSDGQVSITDGGMLTTTGTFDALGNGSDSSGDVTVDGTGSLWDSTGAVSVGVDGDGTLTVSNDASVSVVGRLDIGDNAGGSGTLDITSGGKVTSGGSYNIISGNGSEAGSGTVTVDGDGSSWTTSAFLGVGRIGGGGLTIENDGSVAAGQLAVGSLDSGDGTVVVETGGSLTTGAASIGSDLGSEGTVTVDGTGALWDSSGQIGVGVNGDGTLIVSNSGSVNAVDEIDVAESAASIGRLTIESGGSVTSGGTYDTIGGAADADGTVTVTGPASSWLMTADLAIGNDGTGELDISNQGRVQNAGTLYSEVGAATGSYGTVSIDGTKTTWDDLAPLSIGDGGTGAVSVDGGVLIASGAGAVAPSGLVVGGYHGGTGSLTVSGGGTVTSDGTLDYVGSGAGSHGTVTVDGDGSSWLSKGALTIGNTGTGQLNISDGGSVAAGQFSVGLADLADGQVSITGGGTLTTAGPFDNLGVDSGATGTVTVVGDGSQWLSGGQIGVGINGDGTIDVNAGTVTAAGGVTVGSGTGAVGSLDVRSGGTFTSDGSYTFAGANAGSQGEITVTGTGSLLDGSAAFIIGNSGTGVADVSNKAVVDVPSVAVGQLDQSSGSLVIATAGLVTDSGIATVGNAAGSDGNLTIFAGSALKMTASAQTAAYYFRIGLNGPSGGLAAAQGSVDVDGAGALLDVGDNPLEIGGATGGTGSLTVQHDGTVIASSANSGTIAALSFANNKNATAQVTVEDAGSRLTANGYVLLGRGGNATLTIRNDATMLVNDATLNGGGMGIGAGHSPGLGSVTAIGGSGTATVTSGGVLDVNSTTSGMTVGGNGVDGLLSVNSGGVVLAGTGMTIGTATKANGTIYGGSGALDIGAGGTVEVSIPAQSVNFSVVVGNANPSMVGPTTAASGTVTVSGTNALLDTNGNALAIGLLSTGGMTVSQGGSVVSGTPDGNTISALGIGRFGTGSLTVTDAGSRFTANGGIYVGRGGTGTLTVENGASMSVLADSLGSTYLDIGNTGLINGKTLISGGSGSGLVTSGGYLFSQGGMSVGKGGNSGTLAVNVGGKVEVSQQLLIGNTVTVPAGGADITTTGTTPITTATPFSGSGTVDVGAGGTLQVDGTGISGSPDITIGAGNGSTGTLIVDGFGALVNASGGEILVDAPGPAAGTLDITNGGTVLAGSITAGASGRISLDGGAIGLATLTLNAGADLSGHGTITGDVMNDATMEAMVQGLTVAGTIIGTGLLQIDAGSTISALSVLGGAKISFLGGASSFITSQTGAFDAMLNGMVQGDTIALRSLLFESGATASIDSGVLTVTSGLATETINISGVADGTPFIVTKDAFSNGTDVGVLCFCAGTRIATPKGEQPVERLRAGDLVLTLSGQARAVQWVGIGKVLATRGQRSAATPVIVRKGALADNVPDRDLRITKGHSIFFDGALIPVEYLVNHRSILWDDHAQEVALYHIELETHDVLLANGVPAESYRDDGNRWLFQNANSGWGRPPQEPCAPVLTGGREVDAVWRRLLDRAGPYIPVPVTHQPDLHLLVDGTRVESKPHPRGIHLFRLLQCPAEVRVVSRAGTPAELGLARDPRLLGVALRQIRLWCGARLHVIEASDPSLTEGFHLFEADAGFRWTDGNALLPAALFDGVRGACELELQVDGTTRYPLLGETPSTAAA